MECLFLVKPKFLGYTRTAKNVGPMGSITIMTDEVAYEVDGRYV